VTPSGSPHAYRTDRIGSRSFFSQSRVGTSASSTSRVTSSYANSFPRHEPEQCPPPGIYQAENRKVHRERLSLHLPECDSTTNHEILLAYALRCVREDANSRLNRLHSRVQALEAKFKKYGTSRPSLGL